jgi:hypothetical protein
MAGMAELDAWACEQQRRANGGVAEIAQTSTLHTLGPRRLGIFLFAADGLPYTNHCDFSFLGDAGALWTAGPTEVSSHVEENAPN